MQASNQIIPFLVALSHNNNKAWFDANRPWYQQARDQVIGIAAGIIDGLSAIDASIGSTDPKKCLFRQNRDIRFSANKNPYKTTMSAYFAPGGKNLPHAGYYLHIEPEASFIGGGLYHPEKEQLLRVRNEIYFNAETFLGIINNKVFYETFGPMMEEKLKRPPQGFPADFAHIDLLKYTSFAVGHPFTAEAFTPEAMVKKCVEIFSVMAPFVQFLNQALAVD